MAASDYTGREKASLLNGRALWQHITGGRSGDSRRDGPR